MQLSTLLSVTLSLLLTPSFAIPVSQGNSSSTSSCAIAAAAQAQAIEAFPNARAAIILANQTYDCFRSIPVQKNHTLQLLQSLRAWYQIESQLDYIKNPAPGYLWDGIDLLAHLDRIRKNVNSDTYKNQYDIEVELITLSKYFHDFHTVFTGEIAKTADFQRGTANLVSASIDGIDLPKVYNFYDVVRIVSDGNDVAFVLKNDSRTSAVQTINGIDVQQFLQTQQLVAYSHDPDSMYNQLFFTPGQYKSNKGLGSFSRPVFYPGSQTTIRYVNGSSSIHATTAATTCDFTNVKTGQDYWDVCVIGLEESTSATTSSTTTSSAVYEELPTETATATASVSVVETPTVTQVPYFYPEPEVIDSAGVLSGYFLDSQGHKDVAVLVLKSFIDEEVPNWLESYQQALEDFLAQAKAAKKTKLIIDIQGNGGGYIDAGTELLAQLFPNVAPTQKGNWRASPGLEVALAKLSAEFQGFLDAESPSTSEETNELESMSPYSAFTWQALMRPDTTGFKSFSDFWGPDTLQIAGKDGSQGNYTNFFQTNYTNTDPTEMQQDAIQITGYGVRKLPANTKPPFDAKNIVVLTDGYCGSTCTIATEMLINEHQIPAVAIGGRPIGVPMQTIGNTKGSQIFAVPALDLLYTYYANDSIKTGFEGVVKGTDFENWNTLALEQGLAALNAKNNYRVGDTSETPLAQVYGASDCKMWYDFSMLTDVSKAWARVADIAFPSNGAAFSSKYCANGTTKHSTSVTGGLKKGQLGNQTPPAGAKPKYLGWLRNGNEIVQGFSLATPGVVNITNSSGSSKLGDLEVVEVEKSANLATTGIDTLCLGYDLSDRWFLKMICDVLG